MLLIVLLVGGIFENKFLSGFCCFCYLFSQKRVTKLGKTTTVAYQRQRLSTVVEHLYLELKTQGLWVRYPLDSGYEAFSVNVGIEC